MDCTTIDSANELPANDNDDKASTTTVSNNNVLVANDDVMEQVQHNNPTTSGTSSTNIIEQKCLDNIINISDKIDEQDDNTKTPSSPKMMIVKKGKRTKRQRIHSPIKCTNYQDDNVLQFMTEEDDDEMGIANCLILLSQGPSRPPLITRNEFGHFTPTRFKFENKRPSYNNNNNNRVYECKTCNRTFTSFQALGGHRTSHKKLKITTNTNADNDYSFSPVSLQLGNINYTRLEANTTTADFVAQENSGNKNRIHECAICGAEFSSGQALGGHMRRHRGIIMPLNSSTATTTTTTSKHPFANTTLSLSTAVNNPVAVTAEESKVNQMNDGVHSLDLNLPACPSPSHFAHVPPPTENDETKLSKKQHQTSSSVVLSTPAMVYCFY